MEKFKNSHICITVCFLSRSVIINENGLFTFRRKNFNFVNVRHLNLKGLAL
jgi:hypothetical protein